MALLRRLWTEETVDFEGKYDSVAGAGINPLPVQKPIPMWIGAAGLPPTARAEEIDVAGFCALARAYADLTARKR